MSDPSSLPPPGGTVGEPTEAEIKRILRDSSRQSRRRRAAREALDLSGTARLIAESALRKTVARAVLENLPQDGDELEKLLWPHLALYSETVFDNIAERGLETLKSRFSVRRYRHWLCYTVTSAVVDEDICPPIDGQIDATAEHVLGVIGETVFPQPADHTRRALWRLRNEMFGDPRALNIETRLKAHLRGGIGRWEAAAIEKVSRAAPGATEVYPSAAVRSALELGFVDHPTAARNNSESPQLDQVPTADSPGTAGDSSQSWSARKARRATLLAEYKLAAGNPSNKRIYEARNSGIHKPQFYEWLRGELPDDSETTKNFEKFLSAKKAPIPREPRL